MNKQFNLKFRVHIGWLASTLVAVVLFVLTVYGHTPFRTIGQELGFALFDTCFFLVSLYGTFKSPVPNKMEDLKYSQPLKNTYRER